MSETSNELSNLKKKEPPTLIGLLSRADVQQKIAGLVGDRKAAFISTLLAVQNGNDALKICTPLSILSAAIGAAVGGRQSDRRLSHVQQADGDTGRLVGGRARRRGRRAAGTAVRGARALTVVPARGRRRQQRRRDASHRSSVSMPSTRFS